MTEVPCPEDTFVQSGSLNLRMKFNVITSLQLQICIMLAQNIYYKEIILEDKRNILRDDQPFDYKLLKDEKAQIYYNSKLVKLLTGKDYAKLIRVIDEDDSYSLQLFMAKVTGNFKHGNEKTNK